MAARRRNINIDRALILDAHRKGQTIASLAGRWGVSSSTICRRLHLWGMPVHHVRMREQRGYLVVRTRGGRDCRVHRACWEAYNGAIPAGHVIHHVDGDRKNNVVDNLRLMTPLAHAYLHAGREEGGAKMRTRITARVDDGLVAIDTDFYVEFCRKLRISQGQIANATGYSATYCAEISRGERTRVAVKFLTELAAYLRIIASGSDALWYQALLAD